MSTISFQSTLTESTPTPNSPILTDTWTPVDASISFTSSSKLSRGGFGHFADFFRHPIAGNVDDGSLLTKTAAINPDSYSEVVLTTQNLGGHLKTGHTWTLQNRPTK